MELPESLVKLIAREALSYGIAVAVGLMIGWLFHKKQFRELREKIDGIEKQPTVNIINQVDSRSVSLNEKEHVVKSKTITHIESMPQAEYNKLKEDGKTDESTIYLTN